MGLAEGVFAGGAAALGEVEPGDGLLEDAGSAHEGALGGEVGFLAPLLAVTGGVVGQAVDFDHNAAGSAGSEDIILLGESGGREDETQAGRE